MSTDFLVWGAQFVKGDKPKEYLKTTDRLDIPRIDYTNGEPSILLEPQRQNLITYSQDFSQWTVDGDASINSNNIISPEGIQNSDKLIAGTTSARQSIKLTSTNSGDLSFSIFAKKGEYSVIQLTDAQNASAFANFNLDTGAVGSTGVYTASMIDMHNDWYRCIISWNASVGIVAVRVGIVTTPTSARVEQFAGNGSDGLYIYGAQLEVGSYATSLIHTSGGAVTRSADSLPNPLGAVGTPTGNKAVIYLEVASIETSNRNFVGFVNGTTNQYGLYHWGATDNYKFGFNTWNTDAYGITGAENLLNGEFNKIAGLFDFTDFTNNKLYINGKQQSISQVKGTTLQRGAAGLGITAPQSNQEPFANFKSVMMFDQELTDEELEKLTGYNNHELYMNYYNRLSYLGLVEEYNVESDINNYIL
jgi:hypothetical protein